ncbi:MAG TPA: hypothetical protein VM943_12220 [Pyrinomonadaceae bacterium]|nr:hypothetical protein [Pyrinomonadaceae bacterium]
MRWKLLLVASLLASLAGASASLVIIYVLLGSTPARLTSPDIPAVAALLVPIGFIIYAAIFVYRHTSRRRALQAITTVLFAIVLTAAALFAASALLSKRLPRPLVGPESDRSNA